MATRATYQFTNQFGDVHTVYIHSDGYPSGAAEYFAATLAFQCSNQSPNASFADRFIRANGRAELTGSHASHTDTDYTYTYDEQRKTIIVKKRRRITKKNGEFASKFEPVFNGSLAEFLATYHPAGKSKLPEVASVS